MIHFFLNCSLHYKVINTVHSNFLHFMRNHLFSNLFNYHNFKKYCDFSKIFNLLNLNFTIRIINLVDKIHFYCHCYKFIDKSYYLNYNIKNYLQY